MTSPDDKMATPPAQVGDARVIRACNAYFDALPVSGGTAANPEAMAAALQAAQAEPPQDVGRLVDWRAMYRFQAAMRFMEINPELTKERAYAMADQDVASLERAAQAMEDARMVAPWPDFEGNPIREGDTIRHPTDGATGTVIRLPDQTDHGDAWRVLYRDGELSRLCLQVGEKGQAVVVSAARGEKG